ncbi:hypothetical protein KAW38_03645, partial [Candidatus Micrarchaeota archaeon]|nr:hypothetical protein [Candidatus Micrarchaeota archaeon]
MGELDRVIFKQDKKVAQIISEAKVYIKERSFGYAADKYGEAAEIVKAKYPDQAAKYYVESAKLWIRH